MKSTPNKLTRDAGWMPIETAPEGQEQVMVACLFKDGSAQLHVAARWGHGWGTWGLHSYQPIVDPEPSHWMPLPDPPRASTQTGDDDT
jgi:hypothetical protein